MKTKTWIGWVYLQVESCGLDCFLFVAGEFGEAICEGIGDEEVHGFILLDLPITHKSSHTISIIFQ